MADIFVSQSKEKTDDLPGALPENNNPLSAFLARPRGLYFDLQEKDEEIIVLLRKHWITNVPWLFLTVVFFFAPLLLRIFPLVEFLPVRYQVMSLIAWYLLVVAFIFEKFLSWFFNVYIVTNKRIIDVDFFNLIYRQVTEAGNDKIQDITYSIGGVIRSLFDYGDVLIQTAGALPNLEFEAVPHPEKVVKVLSELKEQRA